MSFNSSPFIHNGLAASTNPDRCRQRGAGTAHRSERTMCGEKTKNKKQTRLLTQKMKLKKKSMYLMHLVQPSTPMVNR